MGILWGYNWISGLHSSCSSRFTGAVRDDADGGTVQPYEVSHLAEPVILNAKHTLNPLFGKESGAG